MIRLWSKLIIISHRGNINGKDINKENSPEYIQSAIDLGFDVEVDLRVKNDSLFFGHDLAQYAVDKDFLIANKDKLWIHCKDINSVSKLKDIGNFNFFFHDKDDQVLTSFGHVWAMDYVDSVNVIKVSLNAKEIDNNILGVCTDFPQSIKDKIAKNGTI